MIISSKQLKHNYLKAKVRKSFTLIYLLFAFAEWVGDCFLKWLYERSAKCVVLQQIMLNK